jgi:auxin efflux carrier family protein
VIYEVLGLLLAWGVKQLFWVPHRFRFGILVAGGWSNFGDIREFTKTSYILLLCAFFLTCSITKFVLATSVVMSITAGPPFNSTSDQNLAVAYISAFILVFYVSYSMWQMLAKEK